MSNGFDQVQRDTAAAQNGTVPFIHRRGSIALDDATDRFHHIVEQPEMPRPDAKR
jgi:hypothetical protein